MGSRGGASGSPACRPIARRGDGARQRLLARHVPPGRCALSTRRPDPTRGTTSWRLPAPLVANPIVFGGRSSYLPRSLPAHRSSNEPSVVGAHWMPGSLRSRCPLRAATPDRSAESRPARDVESGAKVTLTRPCRQDFAWPLACHLQGHQPTHGWDLQNPARGRCHQDIRTC